MSHAIPVSDEIYRIIETLARARGISAEELTETLLREHLAERAAIARQNVAWDASLDEALARAAHGGNVRYDSVEDFFTALDESAKEEAGE